MKKDAIAIFYNCKIAKFIQMLSCDIYLANFMELPAN